mgnify:FL=1
MNPIVDIIFTATWVGLLVIAIRQMSRGWNAIDKEPLKNYRTGTWTTQVKKPVHPEMADVKPGEELMGVTFKNSSCDLEEYQELQERINELRGELEDPWEDDDDDDGDVPAVVRR